MHARSPIPGSCNEYHRPMGRGRHLRPRHRPHVLDQVFRAHGARAARTRGHVAPGRRGRSRLRLLGGGAGGRDGHADGTTDGRRVRRFARLHRTHVRVRHHGDRRQPRHPAPVARYRDPHRGLDTGPGTGRTAFRHALAGAFAGVADHGTGRDDPGRPDAARPDLPAPRLRPAQVPDPGRPVREHLDRRDLDPVRGASGPDGGRHLELGHAVHAGQLRLEGSAGGHRQCAGCHLRVPP